MSGIFGGEKRDKALEAMQARLQQQTNQKRAELEQDKARITKSGSDGRKGRAQLKSRRAGALKKALGV